MSPAVFEVLRLAALGMTYREIAERRGIAEQTVKNQLYDARQSLGATSTIDAFRRMGWLDVPGENEHEPPGTGTD